MERDLLLVEAEVSAAGHESVVTGGPSLSHLIHAEASHRLKGATRILANDLAPKKKRIERNSITGQLQADRLSHVGGVGVVLSQSIPSPPHTTFPTPVHRG